MKSSYVVPGSCKVLFWLTISLAACGCLIFHLYTIFSTYFAYNTVVKMTVSGGSCRLLYYVTLDNAVFLTTVITESYRVKIVLSPMEKVRKVAMFP